MFRLFLATAALLIPTFGYAQGCSCDRVIPFSGTYRVDFAEKHGQPATETAELNTIDSGEPGTQILAIGNGGSADLKCNGREYTGTLEPITQSMILRSVGPEGPSFGGLRMGDHFKGPVVRPGMVWSIPNEPNMPTLEFTMIGGARKATPLMCDRIREAIDSAKTVQAAYANSITVIVAESKGLGSHSKGETVQPDLTKRGTYDSHKTLIYREMVQAEYKLLLSNPYYETFFGGYPSGIAGTNTRTCEIYRAEPTNRDGTCRPEIELIAMQAHEEVHSRRCETMKEGLVDEGYHKWSNHPSNMSLDEVEAYQAALDVLEPWFLEYCEG